MLFMNEKNIKQNQILINWNTTTMVKKTEEDWKTHTLISSSSSIRKYLDLCKNWLVLHDDNIEPTRTFCNIPVTFDNDSPTYMGMTDIDIRSVSKFRCSICSNHSDLNENGKCITANPFTRAQHMLVCEQCQSTILR